MGKMYYSCAIFQLIMILLTKEFAICSSFSNNTTTFSCIAREKKALLKLKASFTDPFNRLSSWNNTTESDCCTWQGVGCDKITRRVISLHLGNPRPFQQNMLASNQLDSSLSELKYLNHLDVSGNDFQQSPIPTFLGSMKQLQHLDLSSANFSGVVPHHLGNLSSLRVLDLNDGYPLMVDDLKWASNLSRLEHLDLSLVDLSRTKHLSEVIFNMLPSILVLRLSYTQLNNTFLPHACVNFSLLTNIQHLDLRGNSFGGEFPCFLHNMTSLRVLDLSENQYNSSVPQALIRLRNLVHLDLSSNLLHPKADWISEFLSDKCHLKLLLLNNNDFYGDISGVFKNLSMGCCTHKLEALDLGGNKFFGDLPEELGELRQLNYLFLSSNAFTGPIPTSLGKLRALKVLYIFDNKLSGPIPTSLGQLSNLESLALSMNSLNSTLSEGHFAKLSKLEDLSVSSINFSVNFDWVPPFELKAIYIDSSSIGGQFPQWLQTQKALQYLYMSNCSILETLPITWLHSMKNLTKLGLSHNHIKGSISDSLCQLNGLILLDLSKNNFSGNIPDCLSTLQHLSFLKLSFNKLSGVIPNSMGESGSLYSLMLSNNRLQGQLPSTLKNCEHLQTLDVEGNMLSGDLPDWIGTHLNRLKFLRLGKNEFHGVIPSTSCRLYNLQVMDLANNKMAGHIPHCFDNLLGMVKEKNSLSMSYEWYTSLYQVIKGVDMEYTNTLQYLVNLDLSSNNLDGEIPQQLTSLSGLIGLNLSHNRLVGKIPRNIGDMNSLTSLDLSNNKLCGAIPNSLSDLNFLEFLNLSHNNLSGKIPTGNQLQTLNEPSIYQGNPGLCGYPLLMKCFKDEAQKSLNAKDQGDKVEKIIFYGVIVSGFATGFWGIIGVLVLKTSWRHAFFQFAEAMIRKMLGL